MSQDEHYRKLERLYEAAPTNEYYRPAITIGEGTAEIRIPVRPQFHHAAHAVHGSVYFKALDDAAYFAVNSVVEGVLVLTASFHVDLLRPIAEGTLVARGRLVHGGRRRMLAEAELVDQDGQLLARGGGAYMRSRISLGAEVGYV